jgi:hypothetical protein
MSDPLEDFLCRDFSCEASEALRQALRERTGRVLRRQQRLKKLALAGAMAACFLAGMTTMYGVLPLFAAKSEPQPPVANVATKKIEPATAEQPLPSAQMVELQARAQTAERVARLRRAGDLYLLEEQDYAAALRCYAQALNDADAQTLEISPGDTWLEMALKDARRKEKARAN